MSKIQYLDRFTVFLIKTEILLINDNFQFKFKSD